MPVSSGFIHVVKFVHIFIHDYSLFIHLCTFVKFGSHIYVHMYYKVPVHKIYIYLLAYGLYVLGALSLYLVTNIPTGIPPRGVRSLKGSTRIYKLPRPLATLKA